MSKFAIEKCFQTFGTIGAVVEIENGWILRRERRITRINHQFEIVWNLEFPADMAATTLRLVHFQDIVVTFRVVENGPSFLAGYDAEKGKELWTLPFAWQGLNSYGGLMHFGHRLFVAGDPSTKGHLLIIDIATGKILDQLPEPPINPKGPIHDLGQEGLCQVGKWLFSRHRNKELFRANLEMDRPEFELLSGMEWSQCGTDGKFLFWEGVKDGKSLSIRIDPNTMETTGAINLDPIQPSKFLAKGIKPLNAHQAVLFGEEGIAMLDYDRESILWHRKASDIGKSLTGGHLTISGLALLRQAKENALLMLHPESGKTIDTFFHKDAHFHTSIFQIGDWIVANAIAGFILLRPEEDTPSPTQLDWVPFEAPRATIQETSQVPPPNFTPTDQQYSAIITAFVNAKAAQEQGRDADHQRLAAEFNKLFDAFAQAHSEVSIANIALTLSELGVPYEVALADVVRMRG